MDKLYFKIQQMNGDSFFRFQRIFNSKRTLRVSTDYSFQQWKERISIVFNNTRSQKVSIVFNKRKERISVDKFSIAKKRKKETEFQEESSNSLPQWKGPQFVGSKRDLNLEIQQMCYICNVHQYQHTKDCTFVKSSILFYCRALVDRN